MNTSDKMPWRWIQFVIKWGRPAAGDRAPSLWSHRNFMYLWLGQTVSEWGTTLGALGLTALLLLDADATEMGFLATAGMIPVLLIGLQAGVWVDRLHRRPILIAADVLRALLLLSVAFAAVLGWLRMEQLYVVAFALGVLNVLFDVAHQSFVPSLVQRDHIVEGNAKLSASSHIAEVSGPALGGVLVQWFSTPVVLVVDALSFIWSALLIGRIKTMEPPVVHRATRRSMRVEVMEGLKVVIHNPLLRATIGSSALMNFFGSFYAAIYSVYLLRTLGLGPALIGVSVGAGGVGALIGALIAERVARRWGPRGTLVGSTAVMALFAPLLPLAGGPVWLALLVIVVGQFGSDLARTVRVIGEMSLRQSVTSDRLMGRTNASVHFIVGGVAALGMLIGGILGEQIGLRPTAWIASLGNVLALIWLLLSPIRNLRAYPEPVEEAVSTT